ncbi:MAG: hypothetical protein ABII16_03005 [Patescibacteria group bacterium]
MTFQCATYMGEEGINIYGKDSRVIELLLNESFIPFIPEWHIEKRKAKNSPSLTCIFDCKQAIEIQKNGNFSISGSFKEFSKAHTIPYLIHYILELERAKKGKATIHAAAVSKDGIGILILGKQGSGKTSITLELCRKYGFSFIGNDLILAGLKRNSGYLYGGTKIFKIRATTIKDYNKDLEQFLEATENTDEWTNTATIKPEKIQVITEKSIVPIHAIYYVHLYQPGYEFFVKEIDQLFSRIYLYQIFSEYIRGSAITPLIGKNLKFGNYLPSLDSEASFKKRIKFINWIIRNKNYKYISGVLTDICTFIAQNL